MESPPAINFPAIEKRQPFIVVVQDCEPGVNEKKYEETVLKLLKTNEIHEQPSFMSHYACSFTINLLKAEHIRLLSSDLIRNIDPDHSISIE
jgi:hypothetical protein